jgi:hypothetical protein
MKLNQLFGTKSETARTAGTSLPESERSLPGEENSALGLRQQLIQVLLRDTARRAGIPAQWLDCHILLTSSRHGEGMHVRIIMKHWDLRLLTYAAAFEKALMADLKRFEPHADDWLHGISWQLDGGASCPHQKLPHPSVWAQAPAWQAGAELPRNPATPEALAQAQSPARH